MSKIVAQRRLALANFRRNPTPDNLTKLENITNKSQSLIRKAKSDAWHKLCDSFDEKVSASYIWQRMKWVKGFRQSKVYPSIEKSLDLLYSLTADYASNTEPSFTSKNELLESKFSIQELHRVLKKKDSSPGEDDISYTMLYYLPDIAKEYLLNLYNHIYQYGVIPSQWRNIQIVPIPKSSSNNSSEVKLRPISLISCICKTFHLMIYKLVAWNGILKKKRYCLHSH